jgi:hypothetical protein
MSRILPRVVFGVLVCIVACADPTAIIRGRIAVRAVSPDLQITNQSGVPVYSFIVERAAAAHTDWAPCNQPTLCAGIAAGATANVPYSQIVGYTSGAREAIVYWWHLRASSVGFQPDTIRAVVIAL